MSHGKPGEVRTPPNAAARVPCLYRRCSPVIGACLGQALSLAVPRVFQFCRRRADQVPARAGRPFLWVGPAVAMNGGLLPVLGRPPRLPLGITAVFKMRERWACACGWIAGSERAGNLPAAQRLSLFCGCSIDLRQKSAWNKRLSGDGPRCRGGTSSRQRGPSPDNRTFVESLMIFEIRRRPTWAVALPPERWKDTTAPPGSARPIPPPTSGHPGGVQDISRG